MVANTEIVVTEVPQALGDLPSLGGAASVRLHHHRRDMDTQIRDLLAEIGNLAQDTRTLVGVVVECFACMTQRAHLCSAEAETDFQNFVKAQQLEGS